MSSIELLTFNLQPLPCLGKWQWPPSENIFGLVIPWILSHLVSVWSISKSSLHFFSLAPSHHPMATSLVQATITSHLDDCRNLLYGLLASFLLLDIAARAVLLHSQVKSLLHSLAQPLWPTWMAPCLLSYLISYNPCLCCLTLAIPDSSGETV